MALSYITALRNNMLDEITALLDAGTGPATVRIYDGTPPADANTALAGNTLLSQHAMTDPAAPGASAGVLTLSAIGDDASADASGTPSFFRMLDSDSLVVLQGTAGDGGGEDLVLDAPTITAGQLVTIDTGGTITAGNA